MSLVQAMSDGADRSYMKAMKTLEVNPRHPLVQELKRQVCAYNLTRPQTPLLRPFRAPLWEQLSMANLTSIAAF